MTLHKARPGIQRKKAPVRGDESEAPLSRLALLLALISGACVLFLYARTLPVSFAYDDVDYLNRTADILAGKFSVWTALVTPQGEHFIPLLRLVLLGDVVLFGCTATPLRILVLSSHVLSAVFLGLVCRRYTRGAGPAVATALAFAAPAGFSSMWLWFPSGGCLPLGLAGITGAMAALAWNDTLGIARSRLLAVAGIALALGFESTLAPLAAGPAAIAGYELWRSPGRKRSAVFAAGIFLIPLGMLAASSLLYSRMTGTRIALDYQAGLPRALFLLVVSPLRYFFPGIYLPQALAGEGFPKTDALFGIVIAGALVGLFLLLRGGEQSELWRVSVLALAGPVGTIILVGLARAGSSYAQLWDADRYFFTLLIPFSLFVGALTEVVLGAMTGLERSRRRAVTACALALFIMELWLHRTGMLSRIPFEVYAEHARRYRQLGDLAGRLVAAAATLPPGAPPLLVPDANFSFADVHNRRLSTRFLLNVAAHATSPRLQLGAERVSPRDEAILKPELEAWSSDFGEPGYTVRDGRLTSLDKDVPADFRVADGAGAVVSGFYAWEQTQRWMGQTGVLRLKMTGRSLLLLADLPWIAIKKQYPDWDSIEVSASVTDDSSGRSQFLGKISLRGERNEGYRLDVPAPFAESHAGNFVLLTLSANHTWKPRDVLTGILDDRDLSIMVFAAEFE